MSQGLYTRNESSDDVGANQSDNFNTIKNEVKKLFENDNTVLTSRTLEKLREQHGDEIANQIESAYYDEMRDVSKKANKFTKIILKKYPGMPLHKVLKKALKYKQHYGWSDSVFTEFQRVYEQKLVGYSSNGVGPHLHERTRIGKVLGQPLLHDREPMHVGEKELGVLQNILELNALNKPLHSQVMVQSITYRDCAPEALIGKLMDGNSKIDSNPSNHVHPIIAALFFPRIQELDEQMLFADISNIVRLKHEKKPIMTRPEHELYNNLVSDPNDAVCDIDSPITDLRNRVILQKDLWDAVLHLRNGRYYQHDLGSFLRSVDNCRINMYDTPDLVYTKDEGAILRRLLSAFSFRPTVVTTIPINGLIVEGNTYSRQPQIGAVTSIPMVTLRLPLNINVSPASVDLEDSLNQAHWYLEGNTIAPKYQSIIYSKGVMFFYVNRRYQSINVARMIRPQSFSKLPLTVSGFERLNTKPVNFKEIMNIMNDIYELRSVVLVEKSDNPSTKDLIVGTSTIFMKHHDFAKGVLSNSYWQYDPLLAGRKVHGTRGGQTGYFYNNPVSIIPGQPAFGASNIESFYERAKERGTVFVYQKKNTGTSANPFFDEGL
jgi:hypothetical protein